MYNGIGLQTARGSGTNGYVQANKFFVRPKTNKVVVDAGGKGFGENQGIAGVTRKPNKEILEHNRKRQIQLKLLILEETLSEQGYTDAEIAEKLEQTRQTLEAIDSASGAVGSSAKVSETQTHEIAAQKEKQMEILKDALKIGVEDKHKRQPDLHALDSELNDDENKSRRHKPYEGKNKGKGKDEAMHHKKKKKKEDPEDSTDSYSDTDSAEQVKKHKKSRKGHDETDSDGSDSGYKKRSKKSGRTEDSTDSDNSGGRIVRLKKKNKSKKDHKESVSDDSYIDYKRRSKKSTRKHGKSRRYSESERSSRSSPESGDQDNVNSGRNELQRESRGSDRDFSRYGQDRRENMEDDEKQIEKHIRDNGEKLKEKLGRDRGKLGRGHEEEIRNIRREGDREFESSMEARYDNSRSTHKTDDFSRYEQDRRESLKDDERPSRTHKRDDGEKMKEKSKRDRGHLGREYQEESDSKRHDEEKEYESIKKARNNDLRPTGEKGLSRYGQDKQLNTKDDDRQSRKHKRDYDDDEELGRDYEGESGRKRHEGDRQYESAKRARNDDLRSTGDKDLSRYGQDRKENMKDDDRKSRKQKRDDEEENKKGKIENVADHGKHGREHGEESGSTRRKDDRDYESSKRRKYDDLRSSGRRRYDDDRYDDERRSKH